jgi:hypothetical protein
MRLLILPLILTALPASAAQMIEHSRAAPPAESTPRLLSDSCERADLHRAETPKRAESRRLGELPPGDTILSVYDNVGGCLEPRIVRYGGGRAPTRSQPEPVRPRAGVWR